MPEIVALLFFLQGGFRDPAVVLLLHPGLPFQEGQLLFQPVVLFQQLQRLGHEVPALDADQHNKDQDAGLDEKGFLYIQPEQIVVCYFQQGGKMPGDNVEMTIELIHPVAMEQGLTFAIREGGRTVGSGRVATIIE